MIGLVEPEIPGRLVAPGATDFIVDLNADLEKGPSRNCETSAVAAAFESSHRNPDRCRRASAPARSWASHRLRHMPQMPPTAASIRSPHRSLRTSVRLTGTHLRPKLRPRSLYPERPGPSGVGVGRAQRLAPSASSTCFGTNPHPPVFGQAAPRDRAVRLDDDTSPGGRSRHLPACRPRGPDPSRGSRAVRHPTDTGNSRPSPSASRADSSVVSTDTAMTSAPAF